MISSTSTTPGVPVSDINATGARPDLAEEAWPEGDLPEQMGGAPGVTLLPGVDTFLLPATLAQLWNDVQMEDGRTKQKVSRLQLKFDRNSPLVIVGGPHDGTPMRATFTNNPRPRGKKDDPNTAWVSDLAYVLEIALGDRSRPKLPADLKARINLYAGKTIRLEHGLSGQCRPDKVRRIVVELANPSYIPTLPVGPTNQPKIQQTVVDPSGAKGCGERCYTKDFQNPDARPGEPAYDLEISCAGTTQVLVNGVPQSVPCPAVIRGYENVERILPPLGAAPTPGGMPGAAGGTGAGRV